MYLFPQPSIWILYMASNLSFLIIHESKGKKQKTWWRGTLVAQRPRFKFESVPRRRSVMLTLIMHVFTYISVQPWFISVPLSALRHMWRLWYCRLIENIYVQNSLAAILKCLFINIVYTCSIASCILLKKSLRIAIRIQHKQQHKLTLLGMHTFVAQN